MPSKPFEAVHATSFVVSASFPKSSISSEPAATRFSYNSMKSHVVGGALRASRCTGSANKMVWFQDPNREKVAFTEAADTVSWYRAMQEAEFSYLVQNDELHLDPSLLNPPAGQIALSEANFMRKSGKPGKGSNPLNRALNATADSRRNNGYLGIAPNREYSKTYMGPNSSHNWLVEFIDPEGLIYKELKDLKSGNKTATLKAEDGGTFGLGNAGSLPGGQCGIKFNKLLRGKAEFENGAPIPVAGGVVWRLVDVLVPIEEVCEDES
jgi:hypothetical protein